MSKKMITLAMAMAMALAIVAGTAAVTFAGDCKGKVKAVEGASVTVTCGDGTEAMAEGVAMVGDSVEVKGGKVVAAKKKVVEGC
ncbi:MAG: hypothetical protein NT087_04820 [Deltaproteobacteria bacterium]|nr:hypothetical protein [Deltaproteobacteria bacterium]